MSVYLRGTNYWIQYFRNGMRVRESANTDNIKIAKKLLTVRNGETLSGKYLDLGSNKIRLDGLFALVLDDYKRHDRRDLYTTTKRVTKHLSPALGQLRASQFGSGEVNKYIDARKAAKASNGTINRELSIIRRGFKLALQSDTPKVSRVPKIKDLPEENVRQGFVEHATYLKILDALPDYARLATVIGFHTGARKGEILYLQWHMVDLGAGEIRVPGALTKNKKPHVIPIYGEMGRWLKEASDTRDLKYPSCPWVINEDGRRVGHFRKSWARAVRVAGVPTLLFHDLRRSAVRNMEKVRIPRSVAMAISGHRTESVYKRYAIVAPGDLAEAGRKLAALHVPETVEATKQPQTLKAMSVSEGGWRGSNPRPPEPQYGVILSPHQLA